MLRDMFRKVGNTNIVISKCVEIAVFWGVTQCSLVLEEAAASNFMVEEAILDVDSRFFQASASLRQTTRRLIRDCSTAMRASDLMENHSHLW
jgi:hypothetical protein